MYDIILLKNITKAFRGSRQGSSHRLSEMKQVLNSVNGDLDSMQKAKQLLRKCQNFILQHGKHDVMAVSKANDQLVVF